MSEIPNKEVEKKEKPRIHTTISEKTEELINKYAKLKDKDDNEIYGNKSQVIEKSIELLDKYHNPEKEDMKTLQDRIITELNMALIEKSTFSTLVEGKPKEVMNENIAVDIIEWYSKKLINEIKIPELLDAIKNLWVALNFFTRIRITPGNRGTYMMTFFHDVHQKIYSEYWGKYFLQFLRINKKCEVEYFVRKTAVVLNITQY
jgi:hypothetical protein